MSKLTHESHKPTIAVDVDGVIADYSKGWQGTGVIGAPLPGAREFLERLRSAGWKIVLFTTRGDAMMEEYCEQYGLCYDEINDNSSLRGENPGKPIASVYLDDRAVCFNGDFEQAFAEITRFKVWYEPGGNPGVIPEKVKIAGQDWKIVYDDKLLAERSHLGETRPMSNVIAIQGLLDRQMQEETLLHEIIEVIKHSCDLDMDHQTLSTLSVQLHQVLKDNRLKFF